MPNKENSATTKDFDYWRRVILGALAFLLVAWGLAYLIRIYTNEHFFSTIKQDYSQFDGPLAATAKSKVVYTQTNTCYDWKNAQSFLALTGEPIGCFINRAYYFPAASYPAAIALESKIAALTDTSFANIQNNTEKLSASAIVADGKNAFTVTNGVNGSVSSNPAACTFTMSYPNSQPPYGLPAHKSSGSQLMLVTSCGGGAARAYYPVTQINS